MKNWESISKIAAKVNSGELSAVSLVEKSIRLAQEHTEYNALLDLFDDSALQKAREIDEKVKQGENVGPLAGVPYIAKDNFLTTGGKTTAGSNILANFESPYQATAINKLEAAGAILVGKANLDAFAHGSSTENSDFGPTKNPVDATKVPGGSSGGSAAAVALEIAPFALGTDTGGSIRLPASFCGVVGLKPTYGLVSRFGVVAMASSTDCIGPLATSVEDIASVLDVISGKDQWDSTTIERDQLSYRDLKESKSKKIGVIKQFMDAGLSDEVRTVIDASIENLKSQGYEITEVDLPSIDLALACYYIIVPAEISSNLSRYDGIRYGASDRSASTLNEVYQSTRTSNFNDENKRRIMIGTFVLSSGYYDAYYKKAQTVRTKLIQEFEKVFSEVDFLVGPVAATTAFKLGENTKDPLQMYLTDIMTVAANLVGVPSISVPCPAKSMPVGLQIMAAQKKDHELLEIAKMFEGEK